ncbi:hypothetical protein GCM10018785_27150 [Streptomyces longispororuber]|uniref:Uncharacterized protein n=1 Tax=Streptomyces longispororuber TaxID=68230 RepID=A0A918ZJN1_9ACTN|nr:hypothetical protein [Streptomyces longispororuber]GHE56421.1 hypothetical protein GCM10018785_27150 [Streptomyces longispororuber]
MTDDGRGADVITLPMLNLAPPGATASGAPDDGVPPPPEAGDLAPPPDFFLPYLPPADDDDSSTVDPDDVAPQMVANASSGTGTPARATASMAMVTMAAIAVAALRGTWSMANYLKARREHHQAVADKAREAADKQKVANAAAGAKKGVQSGPEFGRGATGKGSGGRSGGSGTSGGSGRGTFGQQQKPSPKSGGRGSTANGSTGAGGRGTGSGTGPKGSKNGAAGSGSRTSGSGPGPRTSGPGSSGKGSKGAAGGGTRSSGSVSSKGSPSGAKKSPGTLGKLATGRQQRKNDEAKAQRQAAADHRKADLADRAAARKEAAAEAADRRKRRAEKRKAKRGREKAGVTGPKDPKETGKGKPDEKVDLTKKPKAGDGTEAKKDDTEKVDLTKKPKAGSSKGGAKKTPKAPRKKKPRSRRRKPKGSTTGPKTRGRRRKDRSTSGPGSMPGGDGEWLRPPPGWDVTYKVDLEVIRPEPRRRQPAGITTGRRGLPAGSSGQVTPTRSVPKESPIVMGTAVSVGEVGNTQFVDAELTVYDLIESDEEMGEQILQGVDHMNLVAAKCEGLKSGLENLYAMCIEKKVPGVLVKWCIRLMERAGSVQDKAEALRDSLPRASEAILTARDTAIEADKLRADRVKEAGHVAPAEREYHDRSGA